MVDKFWIERADDYSKEGFEINELGTHQYLVEFFDQYCKGAKKVLDYGCGDGSLMLKLTQQPEVSLYDISPSMLTIAAQKLEGLKTVIYKNADQLPQNYFDCIFISMVFICVQAQQDFDFIIDKAVETKTKNGYVLVANPHPCFRDKAFSSYYTEYTLGRPFNYFNDGEKHQIILRDSSINFYDFNWMISHLINGFTKKGLQLVEMLEVKDNKTNEFYNNNYSPSIIYVFK
jgi:SAM-dependent methyltransferase